MKIISIVTPCFNEEDNVFEIYNQVKAVFVSLPQYAYEHIFIDNASTDNTVKLLKDIASRDKNVKIIVNSRNFGHVRSPFYGLLQAKGDAATIIAADLQEPPALIAEFIKKWEEGFKIVIAVKNNSDEPKLMYAFRNLYYNLVKKLADVELIRNFAGFGMYDRRVLDILKKIEDPYPYVRGIISEIGFEKAVVEFTQPKRKKGITKNNFYTLYDLAMLGITNHSKLPLRLAAMLGFFVAIISILIAAGYFIYKLIIWRWSD